MLVKSPYSTEKRDTTGMKSTQTKMKCTWPMQEICVGDPARPILHLFALGVGVGGNANFRVFRYQHVGIVAQWDIGFSQRDIRRRENTPGSCHPVVSESLGSQC